MSQASIFWPERMDYVELVSPLQSAYHLISEIAVNGRIQLIDQNTGSKSLEKRYTDTYLQCEEAKRSLSYMKNQLEQHKLLEQAPKVDNALSQPFETPLSDFIGVILDADSQLRERTSHFDRLKEQLRNQREKLALLNFYLPLLDQEVNENSQSQSGLISASNKDAFEMQSFNNLPSCSGFVANESVHKLQNMILRITRRNAIMHFGPSRKDVTPFCVFATSSVALQKIKQIAGSFSRNVYEFPSAIDEIQALKAELKTTIIQTKNICDQAKEVNIKFLQEIAQQYWAWDTRILREIQIWSVIDYGDFSREASTVVYNGWMPRRFVKQLPTIAERATQASGSPVPIRVSNTEAEKVEHKEPPTFIETTPFQYTFQLLNNAYGIPCYHELNAGAFYQMYPFLFGVMFGDIGHSIFYILAAVALFVMASYGKKKGNNFGGVLEMIDSLKWFLLFASLSALYSGFMYNECFGIPLNLFGSSYVEDSSGNGHYQLKEGGRRYPFGMDPVWMFKENELIYFNSYKMKLSIVMGMAQMIFGLCLSLINKVINHQWEDLICHTFAEFLYLVPFFGYLVFVIIYKWCVPKEYFINGNHYTKEKANLIQVMINMILGFGSLEKDLTLYDGQLAVQTSITIMFFASIPLYLFAKPFFGLVMHRKEPGFSFLEAMVMNLIHVIEFCLSALSHTASYLRLWALSLAHSQLSHVLWEQLFMMGDMPGGNKFVSAIMYFFLFIGWAVMSIAILLGMEAFSALLHAIRLMWVEFSSKFYTGMGYEFAPVSVRSKLKENGYN